MADLVSSNYGHFDDLVFEKRNISYGAYPIRKSYTFNIFIGLVIGLFIIGVIIIIPYINAYLQSKRQVNFQTHVEHKLQEVEVIVEEEKEEFKPEDIKPDLVQFTVPIVTVDEVVETVTQEDLIVSNPGNVTQDGIDGFVGLPDGDGDEVVGNTNTEDIFTIVEQYPSFPGGDEAWKDFLDKNMQYPTMAREQGITGKVWLEFIVDKFGNVSHVKAVRGIGGGCDEEAVRVISMSPRWNPARQSGRPVNVKYNFPINFALR